MTEEKIVIEDIDLQAKKNKRAEREAAAPVYNGRNFFPVAAWNVGKIFAVAVWSKAFILMLITGAFAGYVIHESMINTKTPLDAWQIGALLLLPGIFAFWWMEKDIGRGMAEAIMKRLQTWKS